jgi:hypothetical protein
MKIEWRRGFFSGVGGARLGLDRVDGWNEHRVWDSDLISLDQEPLKHNNAWAEDSIELKTLWER